MPQLEWDGIWKKLRDHVKARDQWNSEIVDAFRERMFEQVSGVIQILSNVEPDLSVEERMERLAIAILLMFDGCSISNIGYTVAPSKDGVVGPNLAGDRDGPNITGGLGDGFESFLAANKNSDVA